MKKRFNFRRNINLLMVLGVFLLAISDPKSVYATQEGTGESVDYAAKPINQKMRTTDRVNIRSGPGTEFRVLEKWVSGEEFIAVGETKDGWYQLILEGKEAYIKGDNTELIENIPLEEASLEEENSLAEEARKQEEARAEEASLAEEAKKEEAYQKQQTEIKASQEAERKKQEETRIEAEKEAQLAHEKKSAVIAISMAVLIVLAFGVGILFILRESSKMSKKRVPQYMSKKDAELEVIDIF